MNSWLFPQNSCDMKQFFITLDLISRLNGISRKSNIQELLMTEQYNNGAYNPQIKEGTFDISSANHKIDEPRFYGAIYETPNKRLHVSTYGELLLKYMDDKIKQRKVFIGMLYNIQFDNPYKKMKGFNIYPLRLVFTLLCDSGLGYQLSNLEIAYFLYDIRNVDRSEDIDLIVKEIKSFRELSLNKKIDILKKSSTQFIKNYISCNYLFNMLETMKIVDVDKKDSFKLKSGNRAKATNIRIKEFRIKEDIIDFVKSLNQELTVFDDVKKCTQLRSDWIREIYNTVPSFVLESINEEDEMYTEFLQIPKMLVETSITPEKWDVFEEFISKSFNLFVDVKAETIGGSGEPDSLCCFTKEKINFCADGKSTKNKLHSINDGRLRQHREKYNAKYTIIVTPGYVPSAAADIKNTNTCIITSYCFADLITKYVFKFYKDKKECSYGIFHNLIMDNLGSDLSDKIYDILDDKIGVSFGK